MEADDPVQDPSLGPIEKAARSRDVYVFYTKTSNKVPPFDPGANPDYRFLADLERCTDGWRWTAFSIIELEDLLQLREAAERITMDPDPPDETAKPVKYGQRVLRRTKHFPYFGFARLNVERRRVGEVLRAINEDTTPSYSGSALVQGRFEILVEVGADSPEAVCSEIEALRAVPGVKGVEGARVTGDEYYYRPRKRKVGEPEDAA
jgi:hypothetical protein